MKLIIAGGRFYNFTEDDLKALDLIHNTFTINEVVSNGSTNASICGIKWAAENNIPIKIFEKEFIRNTQMAEYLDPTDAVILFPGNAGTNDMAIQARKKRLKIFDHRD